MLVLHLPRRIRLIWHWNTLNMHRLTILLIKKSSQNKHRQTVNNMVSFNAIKNFMIELISKLANSRTYGNIDGMVYQGSNLC
jgi:hypothetical protein